MSSRKPIGAQIRAVQSSARRLLVVAPPGCGKTEVLAMRADHLLRSGAIRPGHRLLALTFTNRARDNLRERLARCLGEARLREHVHVVNFHQFGAQLIAAHYRTIGIRPGFSLPDGSWQRKTLAQISPDPNRRGTATQAIARCNREPLTDAELLQRLLESADDVAVELERRRQEQNHLDHPDVLRQAHRILLDERVARLFRLHFDAVIVDEFQDLTPQQYEITKLVCDRNRTYVGDPHQGIFGWAGAEPATVFQELMTLAEDRVDLDMSFRSSPAVLDVVNALSHELGATTLCAADPASWDRGGHAQAEVFDSDDEEAAGIVALTGHLTREHPQDSIAVMCRAAYRRRALQAAYDGCGQHPQFWDIALDTPNVVRLLKRHAQHLAAELKYGEQVEALRLRVLEVLDPTDVESAKDVASACEQLLEHEFDGISVKSFLGRVRDDQSLSTITPGVHVLNAHVGKGQQFDWVVVMGLEEGHVPDFRARSNEEIAEGRCVLLVMLSRARKGIFLTRAARVIDQYGRSHAKDPSRWWTLIAEACRPNDGPLKAVLSARTHV